MWKVIVMRAARPWGSRLVERLLEAGAEVVAHSSSERKLERLKKRLSSPSRLHTVSGAVGNLEKSLAVAQGTQAIFYDAYLTYDDKPEKVQHHLEVLSSLASATEAKQVIVEGVYRPGGEVRDAIGLDSKVLRIFSPELYGVEATDTLIYYAFQRMVRGKPVRQLFDSTIRLEYAFFEDALRDTLELALSRKASGTWRLRTNGPISQAELLTAACTNAELPLFKPVAGWKLGLLLLAEPRIGQMMEKYLSENHGVGTTNTINYVGGGLTSYEMGATITIERLKAKIDKNVDS